MEINNYIDFDRLFNDIVEEQRESMEKSSGDCFPNPHILRFVDNNKFQMTIETEECVLDSSQIVFCFGITYDTANESDNSNEWSNVVITYDIMGEHFTDYEQN